MIAVLNPYRRIAALSLALAAILMVFHLRCGAQVVPDVRGGQQTLWAGVEYSNFTPDFGPSQRLSGLGAHLNFNWNARVGVEGEMRFLRYGGFNGETEDSYLAGPKISIFRHGPFRPYVKVLFGVGDIRFPYKIGSGSYFAYAPGAGLDYRLTRRFALRGQYEFQLWPSAPGIAGEPSNGLHPNGFSAGIAYRIF